MAVITVGTNSYVTEAELTTYATDRGETITGDLSVLLIKAMDYIETRRYIGVKTDFDQALQWPREVCTGQYGCEIDNQVVPQDIKDAQMVAALIVDGGDDLQPTVDRATKREKVDVIEVEYQENAIATKRYQKLDDILSKYTYMQIKAIRV